MKHVSIHIGGLFVSREPAVVETVLGSCVAACVFDPISRVGGMNHFLLPHACQDDPVLERYGEHSMPLLIRRILEVGGKEQYLQAKVFGAASVLKLDETHFSVPKANDRFVRHFLQSRGIPLLAERLGGRNAIKVRMYTGTGKALVKTIPRTQLDQVRANEGEHYLEALARRWSWLDEESGLAKGSQ
jgi:chemotaxis receptor (MCP) glutamine deamidase CheD